MIVTEEIYPSTFDEFRRFIDVYIDGILSFEVHDGDSEDNTLYRNFADCFKVTELMRLAYEAGKRGEEFEIVTVNKCDD